MVQKQTKKSEQRKEPSKEYEKIMNALNYIDEVASESLENADNGEVYILQKNYNIVADFINKKA